MKLIQNSTKCENNLVTLINHLESKNVLNEIMDLRDDILRVLFKNRVSSSIQAYTNERFNEILRKLKEYPMKE